MDHLADAPIANILILAGVIFLAVGIFGRIGGFIGSIFGNIEAGKNSRVLAGILGLLLIVGGAWLHQDGHKSAASNPSPATPAASTSAAPTAAPAPSRSASPAPATSSAPSAAPPGTTIASVTPDVRREPPKIKTPAPQPSPKTAPPVAAPAAPAVPAALIQRDTPKPSEPSVGDDRLVGTWNNLTPHADSIRRLEVVRVGQDLDARIVYSCASGECDHGIHRLGMRGNTPTYDDYSPNRDRHYVGSVNRYASDVLLLTVNAFEPGTQHHWRTNWVFVKSTLSGTRQSFFAEYLTARGQKALAITPGGAAFYQSKAASADDAARVALERCEKKHNGPGCRIILLNNEAAE